MTTLKELRQAKGWSMEEFGAVVGYSASTVCRIENGERELSPDAKVAIARTLKVPIRKLFPSQKRRAMATSGR